MGLNAFEIPGLRFSLPAGGAVARRRFVTVGTNSTAAQATATSTVIGASLNAVETDKGVTAAQQVVEIADGIVIVEAGGVIAEGAKISSDADGKAVTTSTGGVVGVAITAAAAAGNLVTVKVQ